MHFKQTVADNISSLLRTHREKQKEENNQETRNGKVSRSHNNKDLLEFNVHKYKKPISPGYAKRKGIKTANKQQQQNI